MTRAILILWGVNVLFNALSATALPYSETIFNIAEQQPSSNNEIAVTGRVVDKNNSPLAGVNVMVMNKVDAPKGSATEYTYLFVKGVTTDHQGEYKIDVPKGHTLCFSYIGFVTEYIDVGDRTKIDVILSEDAEVLDEFVVTGYERIDRRESASSVFTIKGDDILKGNVMSVDQMLQGKIPGMSVLLTSGEPSAAPKIRIRGNATISGNKAPVWVVDGVIVEPAIPLTATDINSEDAEYLIGNAISGLNPQDIESITVLKDASATAIYGVKAANGVIVVTTKGGKKGRPSISYTGGLSINQSPSYNHFDRMNSQERIILSREIVEQGVRYPFTPTGDTYEGVLRQLHLRNIDQAQFKEKIMELQTRNTDWYNILFRTAIDHSHNVSISGGGDKANYYFSAGYNNNLGAAIKSSSERFTALAKLDFGIGERVDIQLKFDLSTTDNLGYHISINPHQYAYRTTRTLSPYIDGDKSKYAYYQRGYDLLDYNILNEMDKTGRRGKINTYNVLFNARVKLLQSLDWQATISYNNSTTSQRDWAEEQSYSIASQRGYNYRQFKETDLQYKESAIPYGGILTQSNTTRRGYTARTTLNFRQTFANEHIIQSMAGLELRSNKYTGVTSTGYGWVPTFGERFMPVYTDRFILNVVKVGTLNPVNTNKITQVASYFATLAYSYGHKYTLNANIRSDGSNKFGSNPKYRWLPTWSVAGKWVISEENWMMGMTWVDLLALRASYGIQGNIHEDSSPELVVRVENKDPYSGLDRTSIYRLPNPDLRWEKTHSWNVAIDYGFWDNRIRGSFDFYRKNTSDLIYSKKVATSNGVGAMTINSGSMKNYGFEGFISADLIRGQLFDWRISVNFARNVNEVVRADDSIYSKREEVNQLLYGERAVEGKPLGAVYAFRFAGLSPDNGYALFYSKDGRKVHFADPQMLELVYVGSLFPTLSGGFDTQLTYNKRLSLNLGFSYSLGGIRRLPNIYENSSSALNPLSNVSKSIANRWKKPGDETITDIPAIYDRDLASELVRVPELVALEEVGAYKYENPNTLYNMSDALVVNANYLRLRTVALSYAFSPKMNERLRLSAFVIRLQANNLYVWANKRWNGLDPETPQAAIPILPSYTFNINMTF